MAFNVLGFALASALTQNIKDRQRASQLSLLGGVLNGPVGLVLVASAAQQDGVVSGTDPAGGRATRVAVPEVGEDIEQAKRTLELRGLNAAAVQVASDGPIGQVIGTNPDAGVIVLLGSTVTIDVSAGLVVPRVVGEEREEAEQTIADAGFAPVVREAEEPGVYGRVQKQRPAGGESVDAGSEVELFVVGAEIGEEVKPTRVSVPRIGEHGEGVEQAKRILKARGLRAADVIRVASDRPMNEVIRTNPKAGTIVVVGSTVAIDVSAGLKVPDVLGKQLEEAESDIADAGFTAVVRVQVEPADGDGSVLGQRPAGGEFLDAGSEVELFVGGEASAPVERTKQPPPGDKSS